MILGYFKILSRSKRDSIIYKGTMKRLSVELEMLKEFTIEFPLKDDWRIASEKYLLEAGMATKQELESLRKTVDILRVDFKNEDEENFEDQFKFDSSKMTASYGPYVVDEAFKDKTFSLDMAA